MSAVSEHILFKLETLKCPVPAADNFCLVFAAQRCLGNVR